MPVDNIDLGFRQFYERFNQALASGFRKLIEEKHLYQRVEIDVNEFVRTVQKDLVASLHHPFETSVSRLKENDLPIARENNDAEMPIWVKLSNLRLFCRHCDRKEAFMPIQATDPTRQQIFFGVGGGADRKLRMSGFDRGRNIQSAYCFTSVRAALGCRKRFWFA